jgi:predicted MFS family arabinose efflux permease
MTSHSTREPLGADGAGIHPAHPGVPSARPLTPSLVRVMAAACGISVAGLYYNQPLLGQMAAYFHVGARDVGWVAQITQIGCAAGMFLFVPLGDILERRKLIVRLLICSALSLTLAAAAPGLGLLLAASFCIGLTSVVPHLLLPFAAQLSAPAERGRSVGSLMSGLLIGILLARTVSGYVGSVWGWRAIFSIAACVALLLAALLAGRLPRGAPSAAMSYRAMLASICRLVADLPILRAAAAIAALTFGAFSVFWTTLVFHLAAAPLAFHPAARVAGLFGLVGVVGALAAPLAGMVADRHSPVLSLAAALAANVVAFILLWRYGNAIWGLIAGVILLDFGVQSGHVSNQARIYSLIPDARSRLNTVYMVSFFTGGSMGSALGAYAWSAAGWRGVCMAGMGLCLAAVGVCALTAGSGGPNRGGAGREGAVPAL